MIDTLPLPSTEDLTDAPFWQAALRSQLAIQRCDHCNRMRFPPRLRCSSCQSVQSHWHVLSGSATVWSYATPRRPLLPAFEKIAPYFVVLAQMDEDPLIRIVGNLACEDGQLVTDLKPVGLKIGAPLRVCFRLCAPDVALPCWILTATSPKGS